MEPTYSRRVPDGPIQPVKGFRNIDSTESYRLLGEIDVRIGTFIVRPSSNLKTYTMDVKGDQVISYRFENRNKVYSFTKYGQDPLSANTITDLIEKIMLQNNWEPLVDSYRPRIGG